MTDVSFYCAHCGRLVKTPADRQGTLMNCPFCGRGLSVPIVDSDGHTAAASVVPPPLEGAPETIDDSTEFEEGASESNLRSSLKNSSILVRSYLIPEKSRRIDVSRSTKINWFKRGGEDAEEVDESVFLVAPDLSDDEFINRLHAEPTASIPRAKSIDRLPVYKEEVVPWSERVDFVKLGIWTGITVVIVGIVTVFVSCVLHFTKPGYLNAELVMPEPTAFEGVVVYKTTAGKLEGDEGAFIFLFPAEHVFSKPLATYGAAPNKQIPIQFNGFLEDLRANGGYFERVGFDGYFSVEVKQPGRYRVLIVSYNVPGNAQTNDKTTLKEIKQYLFDPEELLERNRFFWETVSIEGTQRELEVNMGKI